jgi:poly(glycerol-phosphate) alpha-glucosyltransferase
MISTLSGKKIGLLTATASRLGGGVFEAVVAQANLIRDLEGEVVIFSLRDEFSEIDKKRFNGAELRFFDIFGPKQIGYSPNLVAHLVDSNLDCLHLHGIWMYPSRAGLKWARKTSRPYIISPHGMLDPWITSRGRLKKAIARLVYERASWRSASVIHALTKIESQGIINEIYENKCYVIPNFINIPNKIDLTEDKDTYVYIGRIHKKKNLIELVNGWHHASLSFGGAFKLKIAGWGDDGDVNELISSIDKLSDSSIEFIGPIFGQEKDDLLCAARFVILPSLSEGLPMAIIEAWSFGIPTIMTDNCNLPQGYKSGASIRCGESALSISAALIDSFKLHEDTWQKMSCEARKLVEMQFSFGVVAAEWLKLYLNTIAGS